MAGDGNSIRQFQLSDEEENPDDGFGDGDHGFVLQSEVTMNGSVVTDRLPHIGGEEGVQGGMYGQGEGVQGGLYGQGEGVQGGMYGQREGGPGGLALGDGGLYGDQREEEEEEGVGSLESHGGQYMGLKDDGEEDEEDLDVPLPSLGDQLQTEEDLDVALPMLAQGNLQEDDAGFDDDEDEDDNEEEDDDEDVAAPPVEGSYDPNDYLTLAVDQEMKEMFSYIVNYTPQIMDLDTKFKPFIPDYIPAVGDIDAYIRVPRPDNKQESIGLKILDEPSARQSDPNVLELQLRVITKQSAGKSAKIKKIVDGDPKEMDKWIRDISDLHRSKPNPTVNYQKPMPDIDSLMQEWPEDMEEMILGVGIPTADLNTDIATQVDIMCSLLDIPIYRSRTQSLHVLFSLYSAFKSAEHFGHLGGQGMADEDLQYNNNYNSNFLQL